MDEREVNKIIEKIKKDNNLKNEIINLIKKELEKQQQSKKISIIAILTLIVNTFMLIATTIYVIDTHDIMKTTVELNSLGIRPYVAFQDIDFQLIVGSNGISVIPGIKLHNVGNGIANYEAKQMDLIIYWNGEYKNNEFVKGVYSLYPNEETTYSLPEINFPSTSKENLPGLNGSIEYTIEYYGAGSNTKYKTHRKINFYIDSIKDDGSFHITYRYEPGNEEN